MKKQLPLFVFAFAAATVNGQVFTAGTNYSQYTDVSPDKLLGFVYFPYTYDAFDIDMFGDTAKDLQIYAQGAVSSGGSAAVLGLKTFSPNMQVAFGRLDSTWDASSSQWLTTKVARPFNAGEQINAPGMIWEDSLICMVDNSGASGWGKNIDDWVGGDRYIGVRYTNGSGTWYGWVRVNCFSEDSLYVKDYSTAMMSVGLSEIAAGEMEIYPNPSSGIFWLDKIPAAGIDVQHFSVTDLTGRTIRHTIEMSGNRLRLLLPSATSGCYILNYAYSDVRLSRRIVINNN